MRIRKAKQEDIKSVAAFDKAVLHEKQKKTFLKNSINDGNCYTYVNKGEVVGYAVLEYTFFNCGFISMLYIKEEYRRRGIGIRLIEHLENKCKTKKLFTSTNKSNKPMQKLLNKMNYQKSGIVHNLDPGDPELFYFKKVKCN
jgi:ribosomal protein S18 acetylase RimI-like enzyme